ncbi:MULTISPECIES: hypothetical protein [unclassified Herbaspirillum]|uniref:hypothetical protein n=1 Tax=unclassified Herbaspirillum TaxID=2624150 RepID=UPI000C0A329B|nr:MULTISPECIES: hypothetical protein [unclassified Herbaspirillum]MAF04937.1 hypothetical protein [Herbaspirillum sp.]MBO18485.1 hypothetical protein [Herbaspirillum sp.]|tara:strand:- start:1629 stop:1985 length:357 start_codon:yes stop_codon:yes gene_type:complete
MRGHRQVVQLRREGYMPSQVFVDLVDQPRPVFSKYDEPENGIRLGSYPQIEVLRREVHGALDLRFLVGLVVHVHGAQMDDDMLDLLDLIAAQEPRHMVACAGDMLMQFQNGKWESWKF